jgi:hypothetical protein
VDTTIRAVSSEVGLQSTSQYVTADLGGPLYMRATLAQRKVAKVCPYLFLEVWTTHTSRKLHGLLTLGTQPRE